MLWACFALPELSLESLESDGADRLPEPTAKPRDGWPHATHDAALQRPRIVCANAAARAAGVRAGMALVHAQSLLPELRVRRHDVAAQARRLELLGALAYGFSSLVVLAPPDAVLLEIGASRALFGDWKAIEAALRARLAELGHRATLAAAPTPAAARVLADLADGYAVVRPEHLDRVLARVPVGAARLGTEHVEELRRVGVRTLGDAFALPRAALARRFGEGLLQAFDRLRGHEPESCVRYRPPDRFERRIEFDYGIAHQDAMRFPLQRLARELAAYLQARDGGVPRFTLRFEHDPHEHAAIAGERDAAEHVMRSDAASVAHACGASAAARMPSSQGQPSCHPGTPQGPRAKDTATSLDVGLRKPCRDADALFEAACRALEHAGLPAPAHAITLVAEELPPFAPELRDLFEPGLRGQLDWDGLAERLRARLGAVAVRELALHADHRPERAWRVAEPQAGYPGTGSSSRRKPEARHNGASRSSIVALDSSGKIKMDPGLHRDDGKQQGTCDVLGDPTVPARPLWLLPRPVPFRGRIVRLVEPPERIETGWWDGGDIRRDYAIADLDTGQRAWLFRIVDAATSGAAGAVSTQQAPIARDDAQGWMLHGWFA